MKLLKVITFWMLFFCEIAVAAESSAQICIIGVGAKPPRRYSVSGEMLLPSLGEVPPNRLYYRVSKKGVEWRPINLSFNNLSAMVDVPAEKIISFYQKEGAGYKKYISIAALKEGERRIVFLTPSGESSQPWSSKPDQHNRLLGDDKVKEAQVLMLNLSRTNLQCKVGNEKVILKPSKESYYHQLNEGLCRVSVSYGVESRAVCNSAVRLLVTGRKYLYVFYDAEPQTNAGSAVGVFRMMVPEGNVER